jgi:hypothetical protein
VSANTSHVSANLNSTVAFATNWACNRSTKLPRKADSMPRISRLLALAHHCFRLVQTGAIINQSELAHFGQISTTRMTQIMWMDNLAPDIQEEILFLPRTTKGRDPIKEADLRPIAKTLDWNKQRQMWKRLRQGTIGLQRKTISS